jgi:hypothetical protein
MRGFLDYDELVSFDDAYEYGLREERVGLRDRVEAPIVRATESVFRSLDDFGISPSQMALVLVGLGTLGVVIAEFMPYVSSDSHVVQNQIIQHDGWVMLILVAGGFFAALRPRRGQARITEPGFGRCW